MDASGIRALVALGRGDMRRSLNILQSTAMGDGVVDEAAVYACTGQPTPGEVERVISWLLNEPFADAYAHVEQLRRDKGLALIDLVTETHAIVVRLELAPLVKAKLLADLADLEDRLSTATDEHVQLASLVGAFALCRDATASPKFTRQ